MPPSESSELQVVHAYLWDPMVLKNMRIGSWVFISRERLTDYALLCRSARSYKSILKSSRRLAGQMDLWAHVQEDRTGHRRAMSEARCSVQYTFWVTYDTHRTQEKRYCCQCWKRTEIVWHPCVRACHAIFMPKSRKIISTFCPKKLLVVVGIAGGSRAGDNESLG